MRELFFELFRKSHFGTGISITAFSIPHIVYLILIFGGIVGAYLVLRKRSEQSKEKALRFLCDE